MGEHVEHDPASPPLATGAAARTPVAPLFPSAARTPVALLLPSAAGEVPFQFGRCHQDVRPDHHPITTPHRYQAMNERIRTLLQGRRERLRRATGRDLTSPPGDPTPLSAEEREHLLGDARDLYWNELEWENLTEEERLDDGAIVDLTFPGFLAYVRGLLLSETMPDSLAPASPRPQVVEDILSFLGGRVVELREQMTRGGGGDERTQLEAALAMTSRLLDLVLFEFYRLTPEEIAAADAAGVPEA